MIDAHALLATFGTLGVFAVLFLEAGTLLGVVLPGGGVLFTAGVLCAAGEHGLNPVWVLLSGAGGTVLGMETSYWIGRRTGPALIARLKGPRLVSAVAGARELLDRHGPVVAVVVARFVPVVRTLSGRVAGALGVPAVVFTVAQSAAGLVWAAALTLGGYFLGAVLPGGEALVVALGALLVLTAGVSAYRRRKAARG
ncbi:DedA family protein [Streptomyces sp. YC504]|uniref:DedA family protein n=1 Tax=Streptomyces mesophilus TaxID=1775132 RepID=A0A6G4XE29_9ACTN|nr:DedA family protein [Streptomyces mesophilus]NGO74911.1 DedA family protein [Streptomyces mesophilus]